MSFSSAAAGFGTENSSSLSLTTHAVGNFILCQTMNQGTALPTGLSSSNVTWTPVGPVILSYAAAAGWSAQLWFGVVTSASTQTLTATFGTGTLSAQEIAGHEFASTAGIPVIDQYGWIDSGGTANMAALIPSLSGELYWGFAYVGGTSVAGSTTGYTYEINIDGYSNGDAYDFSCTAGAVTFPVWGSGIEMFGISVLVAESPVRITTAALPGPVSGGAYSQQLSSAGGSGGGYTYARTAGTLPTWASLSSGGVLSGTCTDPAGTQYSFTVQVTDSGSHTAAQAYTLAVATAVSLVTAGPGQAVPGAASPAVWSTAVTRPGAAALSGTGTLTAAPAVILLGGTVLAGTGTLTVPGAVLGFSAVITGSGSLTATGRLAGTASLAGTGALAVPGAVLGYSASLSGAGTLTGAGLLAAAAGLSGAGTITEAWALILPGAAALSGAGALTAGGALAAAAALAGSGSILPVPPVLGFSSSMAGSGSLSASAVLAAAAGFAGTGILAETVTIGYAAALAGSGTATSAGAMSGGAHQGSATLEGDGAVTPAGTVTRARGSALAGTGALAAAWALYIPGAAVLAGTGALAVPGVILGYSAAAAGTGALAASGLLAASAAIAGTGTMTATGTMTGGAHAGGATLAGTGTVAAQAVLLVPAGAALSGQGALAAAWALYLPGAAVIGGSGTLAASGVLAASASLAGAGALAAAGLLALPGAAALGGTGTLAAAAVLYLPAGTALSGTGLLAAVALLVTPTRVTAEFTAVPWPARWHARAAGSRWAASPSAGRWHALHFPPRWAAGPAPSRWRAMLQIFEPVAAVSVEYLNILWESALAGTEIDPTGQTAGQPALAVQFAVPVSSGNQLAPAQPAVWYAASWLAGTNVAGYVAQGLVGPPAQGGLVQLTAGLSYDVWSQLTGTPEIPRKFAGTVSVY